MEARPTNWTQTEMDLLRQVYPTVGAKGCMPYLPGKTQAAIRQTAARYGVYRVFDKPSKPAGRKPIEEGPYPWPPLSDLDRIALREWAYVDRTGQLRPIVTVELEAA